MNAPGPASPLLRGRCAHWPRLAGAPLCFLAVAGAWPLCAAKQPPAAEVAPVPLVGEAQNVIEHPTHHVQGLELDEHSYWITAVDRPGGAGWVFRVDRHSLAVQAQRRIERGKQIHPGGCQLQRGRLWVPVAEYRPRSTSTVVALDPQTLEEVASFPVADHLGALAATGTGTLWGVNWDSRQFYQIREDGTVIDRRDNPTGVAYQDLKWHAGRLWAGGLWKSPRGAQAVVDVLNPLAGTLERRYLLQGQVASGGSNLAREGCAVDSGALYLLPEDGPHSRVYRFALPGGAAPPAARH